MYQTKTVANDKRHLLQVDILYKSILYGYVFLFITYINTDNAQFCKFK